MKIWQQQNKPTFGFDKRYPNVHYLAQQRLLDVDNHEQQARATLECYQMFDTGKVYLGTFSFAYPSEFDLGYCLIDKYTSYIILLSGDYKQVAILDFTGELYYIGKSNITYQYDTIELDGIFKEIENKFEKTIDTAQHNW